MTRLFGKIELVANICIIAAALIVCAAVAKRFVLKSPSSEVDIPGVAAGTKINLADVDWARNGHTLLLVLSTGCKFCSASAPFYQHLVSNAASMRGTKLIAVLPQNVQQSREYLNGLKVSIDDVKQASPASLGVRATPTLMLVNSAGIVTNSWVGQLSPEKEAKMLAQLQ
jgi:hypothetical protein